MVRMQLAMGGDMRNKWLICFLMVLLLAFAFRAEAGTVYLVVREAGPTPPIWWSALYTVDTASGAATRVGDIECNGEKLALADIAFTVDPVVMHGVTKCDYDSKLYTLDLLHPVGGVVQAHLEDTWGPLGIVSLADACFDLFGGSVPRLSIQTPDSSTFTVPRKMCNLSGP